MKAKIRVHIVDDSAVVREVLTTVLSKAGDIEVLHASQDPVFALERMQRDWPDVIILDIEMPRMDGLTFLRKIMRERPTPVIICSSLAEEGMPVTLQALEAGAIAIVTKPKIGLRSFLSESGQQLIDEVRAARGARLSNLRPAADTPTGLENRVKLTADAMLQAPSGRTMFRTTERIVAIGTSTGGTQALEYVLPRLPRDCPGIAVVQHMPEAFTASFARRLNQLSQIEVKEAASGDRLVAGLALIAPGGKHLMVVRSGTQYVAEVKDGPLVSRHRPSVDVLFRSVAVCAGANATGIIMTGMGDDGARGLKEMKDSGARTVAQDEASCVVFGMPRVAIEMGAADHVLPLAQIPKAVCDD
ncbi:MAG: chemotaxis response regulator protein-glutamate methylesterase [Propionivibrio sp.]